MWRHRSLTLFLLGAVHVAGARRAGTPVQKVAGLLTKLREKIQEEGTREAAGYDKFACFCKAQAGDKQHAIDKSDARIGELTAAINALGADIAQLDSDVASRTAELQTEQNQSADAVAVRQVAQAAYQQKRSNLTEAVTAIASAMETLRASRDGVRGVQAVSLLSSLPAQVSSLVEVAEIVKRAEDPGAPPAYEYRSDDIYSVLQSLHRTFKEQLAKVDEEEALAQHGHNMLEGARAQTVMAIQSEIDQKQKISAEKSQDKSTKEGLLNDEMAARSADQSFLDELTLSCQSKAQAWDERSKTRAAEITAITEAIGILKGMGDLYSVNSKLVGLSQQRQSVVLGSARAAPIARHRAAGSAAHLPAGSPPSLLQVAREPRGRARAEAALALLAERGAALGSPTLLALGTRNATGSDPFVQVRGLVKDLISRLEAEASSEATSKSLCDSSMKSAVEKRDKYQAEAETSALNVDATESELSRLKRDVAELASEIADLHKALNDLTDLRSDEKARNNMTVADANAGAAAVRQAISVLRTFYDAQGSLLQLHDPAPDREGNTVSDLAPTTFSGDYGGKTTESKGILGLLEVIASDFERTSSTTSGEETKAESEFQKQSASLSSDISAKTQEKGTKEQDIQTKDSDLIQFQDDLKTSTQLHMAALEELETLKSSCVDSGESWEERKKRREQEIEALKQALAILEDWKS